MGCMGSRPAGGTGHPPAPREAQSKLPASLSSEMGRNSRRKSAHFEVDAAALLSRLEALDEERHEVAEQMQRLQAAELQEGAMDEPQMAQRLRFSRNEHGSHGSNSKGDSSWTSRRTTNLRDDNRRNSQQQQRISAYIRTTRMDDHDIEQRPSNVNELIEMILRGRERARYNLRSIEAGSSVVGASGATIYLPRGGVYVKTKYGAVQFGLPPETIKDSMLMNLDVPAIFVVPKERFNLKFGTNTCEVEFPAYWNFFIKGSTTRLCCSSEAANVIKQVMDEVLEGPTEENLFTEDEYSMFCDGTIYDARPDHLREINYFKEPRNGRVISTATLLNFAIFEYNDDGELEVKLPCEGGTFSVVDTGSAYQVVVDGEVVASVNGYLASAIADPPHILMPSRSTRSLNSMEEFETPDFGVTVLGSADGFTANGTTAGFVLWMRGRGILVDPPAHSAHYLRFNGISSRKITHVILTHCHADHDAGTFQKILLEQRVTVMTTKTIMAAFIRKYALVSSMPEEFLLRLFVFHSVKIAEAVHFQGGTLKFFYSLHALPCIGFRAELAGKSITYSGDTYYDPEGLLQLQQRDVISEQRRLSLLHDASVQESDLLLHEAGIPPIHTPASALQQLPASIRKNLRIIHVSDKRAEEAGFEKVQSGFENTIQLVVPASQHAHATTILQILLSTDLFRSLDVATAIDVLQVTRERQYSIGDIISTSGSPGDFLRIIRAGTVSLDRDGHQRELRFCDYFGEIALLTDGVHSETAIAATRVEMIEISKVDTQYLMSRRPNLKERIMRRAKLRDGASWASIAANSVFASFSMSQVTQLQSVMREESVKAGQAVWRKGERVKDVVLVCEGKFNFKELMARDVEPFMQGALLVDVYALEHKHKHQLNFVAMTDGKIFRIGGEDMLDFLDNNPGAFIWMRDSVTIF
uniref:Cyclic nucleotide-binding domain-containing protein n=1 Tax=Calcidiscus leptoporus TaxID=127549 RepID=A0A7S0J6K5_9EUKA|mmetsp:Transcript_40827/g.95331  ORF Transcript_40827/g.95331 Transcript_40827/m.95331 type:complete len:925 (+) Transcript_40827:133-2907(+)